MRPEEHVGARPAGKRSGNAIVGIIAPCGGPGGRDRVALQRGVLLRSAGAEAGEGHHIAEANKPSLNSLKLERDF